MLLGEVEHPLTDTALGLEDDLLPDIRIHMNRICEDFLTCAAAVNVSMIEEVSSFFQCRLHKALSLRLVQRINTHAANSNDRHI
ncbi:hypothetical protein D3C81_1535960 [compost metagenome]